MIQSQIRSTLLASTCAIALALATGPAHASPPKPSKKSKRELIAGGVLIGLGFTMEFSGAVISTQCKVGMWCSAAFALSFGGPEGPTRYAFTSAGPSSFYVMSRLAAAPLLISGFTVALIGIASTGEHPSTWTISRRKRITWGLFGSGMGVLMASRALRGVFLATGTCQAAACMHGFDQTTLWVGRGLAFAGAGLAVQRVARAELGFGGGPFNSYGLSVSGRF